MPNTPLTATPYPASTDAPDGPAQIQAAAVQLEKFTLPRFASTAARDAAITAPTEGQYAFVAGSTHQLYYYNGTSWFATQPVIVCTSATRPGNPTTGMLIFETDTGLFQVRTGTPAWVPFGGTAGWTTGFAPQIDQGASVNIAKTVTESEYLRSGSLIEWNFTLSITGSGTAGSSLTVTIPVATASSTTAAITGNVLVYDSSGPIRYNCLPERVAATQMGFGNNGSSAALWGSAPNIAIANGDIIRGYARWRV